MPTIPSNISLTTSSVEILNAIRNSSTINYQNYVPIATNDNGVIKSIGNVLVNNPTLKNEFIDSLINRIGKTVITSKIYYNPLTCFKKGLLNLGETIEEIFIELIKPYQYDPTNSENTIFKREKPDIRTAFHVLNYKKFYPITIQDNELNQAFLSVEGVTSFIQKIIEKVYTSANYDEFLVTKYLLAKQILNGMLYPKEIPTVNTENMSEIVTEIKAISNDFTFLDNTFNLTKVHTNSPKDDQYIMINSHFDAKMDVEILASAFNMDKAEFIGHKIVIDSFGKLDNERLNMLFESDPNYVELTNAELSALDSIPCVLLDKDYFMLYDNLTTMSDVKNGKGLYTNYFYHVWKTFSVSPFANNCLFIPSTPTVNSVEITPSAISCKGTDKVQLSCVVDTTSFAPKTVNWSSNNEKAIVSVEGLVTLTDVEIGTEIEITCTSDYDATKNDTCTITVI